MNATALYLTNVADIVLQFDDSHISSVIARAITNLYALCVSRQNVLLILLKMYGLDDFAISVSVQVVLEGQVLGVVNLDLARIDTGGEDVLVVIA